MQEADWINLRGISTIVVTVAMLLGATSAQAHSISQAAKHKVGRGTSTNWSGYAIDGTGATSVTGTWTQPTATCSHGENSWSSPWVGIDGDTSNTVEQTGTDSDCNNGVARYYAWYEMYPKGTVALNMAVKPGNTFTGTVTYKSGAFTLQLINDTTGAKSTVTQTSKKAARSSVEWIMEGPFNGLLTDFGSVPFSNASATINGQSGGLSSFSNIQPITMVSSAGTTRAQPSGVTSNAFSVAWYSH
jgi:Peptidase A4 family